MLPEQGLREANCRPLERQDCTSGLRHQESPAALSAPDLQENRNTVTILYSGGSNTEIRFNSENILILNVLKSQISN